MPGRAISRLCNAARSRSRPFVAVRCQSTSFTDQDINVAASTPGVVTVSYRGRQFEVPRGSKLRTAMLKNNVTPHSTNAQLINCRGIGSCGTCAVQISGTVSPSDWTTAERLRLNFPPHRPPNNSRLRLACQVRCDGDLQVVKYNKFWGEGDEALGAVPEGGCWQPLGQLEFVLDPDSGSVERGE